MPIYEIDNLIPSLADSVYVADAATVIGNATLCEDVSVWSSAVIRADNDSIFIGAGTNIQEGAVLHADPDFPLKVGKQVTIGHQAMLHGCTIEDGALIGIQAVVLNGAVIGKIVWLAPEHSSQKERFFLITLSFLVPPQK